MKRVVKNDIVVLNIGKRKPIYYTALVVKSYPSYFIVQWDAGNQDRYERDEPDIIGVAKHSTELRKISADELQDILMPDDTATKPVTKTKVTDIPVKILFRGKYLGITDVKVNIGGQNLYRIICVADFVDDTSIVSGKLGGCVQKRNSIDLDSMCWLDKDSKLVGSSKISGSVRLWKSIAKDSVMSGKVNVINSYTENVEAIGIPRGDNSFAFIGARVFTTKIKGHGRISDSSVENSVFGNGATVSNCTVKNSTIDGLFARSSDSTINDSKLLDTCAVGSSLIEKSVIDKRAYVIGSTITGTTVSGRVINSKVTKPVGPDQEILDNKIVKK